MLLNGSSRGGLRQRPSGPLALENIRKKNKFLLLIRGIKPEPSVSSINGLKYDKHRYISICILNINGFFTQISIR